MSQLELVDAMADELAELLRNHRGSYNVRREESRIIVRTPIGLACIALNQTIITVVVRHWHLPDSRLSSRERWHHRSAALGRYSTTIRYDIADPTVFDRMADEIRTRLMT